jgi:hypothetical protein
MVDNNISILSVKSDHESFQSLIKELDKDIWSGYYPLSTIH